MEQRQRPVRRRLVRGDEPRRRPVNITGWKMDDSSNAFATAVALRGVSIIPAGKSAIFLEGEADGSTDAALIATSRWRGPDADAARGSPGRRVRGGGVGLSTGGDAVVIFDAPADG